MGDAMGPDQFENLRRLDLAQANLRAAGGSPAEAKAFIIRETEVWGGVIKDANVEAH